jgi:mono/diheme cytochrome c family protein
VNDTVFYILGISLVALALIVSAIGLRFQKFPPSRGALILGTLVFFGMVLATTTFAWRNGEDEQAERNEKIASGEELSPQEGLKQQGENVDVGTAQEEGGTGGGPAAATETAAAADGAQIFEDQGCSGCHTLAASEATATVGPNLDAALKGKDEQFIETSIVDPNDEVEEGYGPNIMPQNYETVLSPEDLKALVQYLSESTSQ